MQGRQLGAALGPADFIALASHVKVLFLEGVPLLTPAKRDEASFYPPWAGHGGTAILDREISEGKHNVRLALKPSSAAESLSYWLLCLCSVAHACLLSMPSRPRTSWRC